MELIGPERLLTEGQRAIDAGDYRWAAEILHKLVFAQPDNQTARDLQADAYEQMGYQAEGPQWRGIFLTAARELREGVVPAGFTTASEDTIHAMPLDILFDFAAVHLDGERAASADLQMAFTFTDVARDGSDETWTVWVRRGVLNARRGVLPGTQFTIRGPKAAITGVVLAPAGAGRLVDAGHISLDGDDGALTRYAGLLDNFDPNFAIVSP